MHPLEPHTNGNGTNGTNGSSANGNGFHHGSRPAQPGVLQRQLDGRGAALMSTTAEKVWRGVTEGL